MKKYLLNQLTSVSAWIGAILVLAAFAFPRDYIAIIGLALIMVPDATLRNWVAKQSPGLQKFFDDLSK